MRIQIVENIIKTEQLKEIAREFYVTMIKGAVDVKQSIVAFGGEYHADAARVLAERGSNQANIWGFNLYFDKPEAERLEYIALINIKPAAGNRDMFIGDVAIRGKIKSIVNSKVI